MEALKPDLFQALADGDSNLNSSMKRVKKSVDATVKFASTCALLKEQSEVALNCKSNNKTISNSLILQVLKQTPMLASISGGYNMRERLRCITELKEVEPAGYVLDGFHTNGETATNLNWEDVKAALTETLVRQLNWKATRKETTNKIFTLGCPTSRQTKNLSWCIYTLIFIGSYISWYNEAFDLFFR